MRRLIEHAQETSIARGFLDDEGPWCDAHVGAMALGLSYLAARRLGSAWHTLESTGLLQGGDAIEQRLQARAQDTARHTYARKDEHGECERRFAGIIFADFAGFSRLPDEELLPFNMRLVSGISERLDRRRGDILLQHTWGDALHVVTRSAQAAAAIATDIQDCLEQLRPQLPGGLSRLELRLSAHYAPVYCGSDPIERQPTYFGSQLSFTARVEPVTPPGMIFVTEAFAAQIALESGHEFEVEYAGEIELAKAFGKYRLFSLRRGRG